MTRKWISGGLSAIADRVRRVGGSTETGLNLPAALEERLFAEALEEFDGPARRAGLWAKHYASADGREAEAKAAYLRERVQQMASDLGTARLSVELARSEQARIASEPADRLKTAFSLGAHPDELHVQTLVEAASTDRSIVRLKDQYHGHTLLHWAARHNMAAECKKLISLGANASAENSMRQMPEDMATDDQLRSFLARARR